MVNIQPQNSPQNTNFCAAFIRPQNSSLFRKTYAYHYARSHNYHHSCVDNNSISDILNGIKVSWSLSRKDKIKLNKIENKLIRLAKDCIISDKERKALNQKLKKKSASSALNLIEQIVKNARDIPDKAAEKTANVMRDIRATADRQISKLREGTLA